MSGRSAVLAGLGRDAAWRARYGAASGLLAAVPLMLRMSPAPACPWALPHRYGDVWRRPELAGRAVLARPARRAWPCSGPERAVSALAGASGCDGPEGGGAAA